MNRRTLARRAQAGFTLIELMIVVAIIGILAAIAIPQYQTYIAKSQVTRVMGEAGALKTAVETCMLEGRTGSVSSNIPTGTAQAADECNLQATASSIQDGAKQGSGVAAATGTGYPQATLSTTAPVTIIATFGNGAAAALKTAGTNTLTWTRSIEGTWKCTATVDAKYRAAACADAT
ncbi:pilin [Variovorax sp. OV084]|jgi:type IV pilus assembly protein PilA|uniref:pilin n=1 Tax=Variovorax sp. OV084 TaxID=1882777 RepID=UPI000B83C6FC|nr:pilin [Variovorax sp. OV084]